MKKEMYKDTKYPGIKELLDGSGYVAILDYGRQPKLDKATGKYILKQSKTQKKFSTLREARQARAEAISSRNIGVNSSGIKSRKFSDVVIDFQNNERYTNLDESYQDHFRNYINHMVDFFGDRDVRGISVVDMEKYYEYQLKRGNLDSAKRNKDGSVSKKEGISVNTVHKHKTGAKKIWEFMIDAEVYGVTENIVERSLVPKVEIEIDGKKKKVSKIQYHPRTLTLDELNYTLNDALQNEFDRSVALMIALASIGALRHSEVVGLQVGKVRHDEYMSISEDIWNYSGYDKDYYKEHDEFIMIDTAIMNNQPKFPKKGIIRVVAKPKPLHEILEYAMEQRMEVLQIADRELTSNDNVYMPLINIIKGQRLNSQKLSRKWKEYQERRNKRMEAQGLEPIPIIRYHDLRHTFSNLTKPICYEWERSYNMGHIAKGDNTTNRVYINDRIPNRDNILQFFNENIKLDWDKALHKRINETGSKVYVNGSGHLVITDEAAEERKKQGKKFIFTESELVDLLGE